MQKVSMTLTDESMQDVCKLAEKFSTENRATAVATSLRLARTLMDENDAGGELLLRRKDGSLQRVVLPGAMDS